MPNCDQSFLRKDHLQRHMLKHVSDEDKPFHCKVCGKGVNTAQHLKRHEITHYKSFKCTFPDCQESFYKHQTLKAHIRAKHTDQNVSKHICRICNKEFQRPGKLSDHMEKHHMNSPKLICDFPNCFKTFRVWSALQFHIKTDHPRLECHICNKKCVGKSGLSNHMKVHDDKTVIKLWKCLICELKFQKKEDAVRHYAEKHPLETLPEELQYDVKKEDNSDKERERDPPKPYTYYKEKKEKAKELKRELEREEERKKLEIETELETELGFKSEFEREGDEQDEDFSDDANSTVTSEYGFSIASPTEKQFAKRQKTALPSSPTAFDLLIDNVDKRIECHYTHCRRLFRKENDLKRHLEWHKKQDKLLDEKIAPYLNEYEFDEDDNIINAPKYSHNGDKSEDSE